MHTLLPIYTMHKIRKCIISIAYCSLHFKTVTDFKFPWVFFSLKWLEMIGYCHKNSHRIDSITKTFTKKGKAKCSSLSRMINWTRFQFVFSPICIMSNEVFTTWILFSKWINELNLSFHQLLGSRWNHFWSLVEFNP